ncbi:MAG TPA: hypothetical protein VFN85_07995 [Solirubrobacterales bacterium]|nr:hypothetical protein [Solirubrobacterales bacterium]
MRALAAVTCEVGPGRLTVALVTSRGKMARNTFYELFENSDDAFRRTLGFASDKLRAAIDVAVDHEGSWAERIGRVIQALLGAAAEEPDLAALSLLHYGGTPGAKSPFDPVVVDTLAGVLRPGRKEVPALLPGPRTEELIAYAILGVIAERLRRGDPEALAPLATELTELALRPFLGEPVGHRDGR